MNNVIHVARRIEARRRRERLMNIVCFGCWRRLRDCLNRWRLQS